MSTHYGWACRTCEVASETTWSASYLPVVKALCLAARQPVADERETLGFMLQTGGDSYWLEDHRGPEHQVGVVDEYGVGVSMDRDLRFSMGTDGSNRRLLTQSNETLDLAWDKFMDEHVGVPSFSLDLFLLGVQPFEISRLFDLAITAYRMRTEE